jgi:autotransporter-associated beta strand protein
MKTSILSRVRSLFAMQGCHHRPSNRLLAVMVCTIGTHFLATPTEAATFTWDGGNANGNWSNGGAGGNWSSGAAPTSSTANAMVFQSNTNAQISNNNIGGSFDVDTLTFSVPMTLGGSSIRFNTATATKMVFGANAVTFDTPLELAAGTTLSTSTANPIIFNGQLVGPGKLTYVNAGTSAGTLFRFASATPNTINGFTLGNASTGKGKATVEIGMDDPFGGAGTEVFLNNSGGVSFKPIGANRVVASGLKYRDNIIFSGAYDLTFQGNGAVDNTTTRTISANLDAGRTLTLGTASSTWANNLTIWAGSGMGVLAAVVSDAGTVGIQKQGVGTWRFTGANTFTTKVLVQQGTLEFNSVENQGSTTASALGKPAAANYTIQLGNTALTASGTLKYVGTAAGGHSTDRPLNLAATTYGGTLDASGTGPISFLGGVAATGLGNKTLTLTGTNSGANTLGGDVVDSTGFATSLVKDGGGKWIITGTKNYTGATSVNAGTLQVDGSITGTASTAVKDTATLGGIGTVTGTLSVESGGTVAPGASVGMLTNNLTGVKTATFNTGAKFAFELATPVSGDVLAFTGLTGSQVTFNNNVINFANAGGLATGTYTLFTFDANSAYTGTLMIGTGLEAFTPTLIYNANNIQVQIDPGSAPLSTVTIVKATDGAEEGPVNGGFTVNRNNATLPVTVLYSITGTATPGGDYNTLTGTLPLGAGVASAPIPVTVLQDNDFAEGTETVIVTLTTDAAYTVGAPSSATVDIADGIKPVVTLVKTNDGAEAGPSNGLFTVSRPPGESSNYALTVNYTVDAGSTATPGDDYTALSGSVVIAASQNSTTISVPVLQDSNFSEGTESVILTLTSDAAYTIGGSGTATVNITDGIKPEVTLATTTQGSEAGPVNGVITATRSTDNGTGTALTVNYTVNGSSSATPGTDYAMLSGTVVIGIGSTSATVTVPVLQDTDFAEGTETVIVDLATDAAYAVGTPGSATVTVTDGTKPEISIVKTTDGDETGPVNGVFTVSRSPGSASSGPVTVLYAATGTANAGSDYTALSGSVVIPLNATSATITVPVLHDFEFAEGTETVIATLTSDPAYTLGTPSAATANITDISGAPVVGTVYPFTATYPFTDTVIGTVTDPTPPPYEKGILFGPFSMAGIGSNLTAGTFYASSWNPNQTPGSPFQAGQYFQVTLTPSAAAGLTSRMTLNTITFDLNRQASIGPINYAVRSSLDNYTANLSTFTIDPANPQLTTDGNIVTIVTPAATAGTWQAGAKLTLDSNFQNLTAPVTFRIYGWGGGQNKDGGIDNFEVQGSWVVNAAGGSGYGSWTSGYTFANSSAFDADNENDGLDNGLEYVLGGDPTLNDAADIMPSGDKDGANYVFTYKRSDASKTDTTQIVQYGSDLVGWTDVTISALGGSSGGATYTVDEGTPTTNPDTIVVTIPTGGASEFFARLKVTQP